jgi:hypothetical protein
VQHPSSSEYLEYLNGISQGKSDLADWLSQAGKCWAPGGPITGGADRFDLATAREHLARRIADPLRAENAHHGCALAYVYFEDEPGRHTGANLLTRDEARQDCAKYREAARAAASGAATDANALTHRRIAEVGPDHL